MALWVCTMYVGRLSPSPPPTYTITTYTAAAKLMYIKLLPKFLFFYMALGLNDFEGGKSITQSIGRGGPF
jgi:hypothetical protein